MVLVAVAEQFLVELAHGGFGDFVQKYYVIGQPPGGKAGADVIQNFGFLEGLPVGIVGYYASQGPFLPSRVRNSDYGRFQNPRMGDDGRFQVYGGNPFAPAFHHILYPVANLNVADGVYRRNIAAMIPTIDKSFVAAGIVVVLRCDPKAPKQQFAALLTVPSSL